MGVNQVGVGVEVFDEAVSRLKKDVPQVGIGFEVVVLVEESLACHIVLLHRYQPAFQNMM